MSWEATLLTFALIDNVILSRLLGVDPDGTPRSLRTAAASGVLFTVLMTASAVAGSALDHEVLAPLGLVALRTPAFVLLVAGFAAALRGIAARLAPAALANAGVSLARAAASTAVLGVVLIASRSGLDTGRSLVAGLAAGAGFFLVTSMMTAIRLRLEVEPVPRALRGFPLQLLTAGLLAYAFLAFDRGFLARFLGQ
jgi:electron transport complex protein RnfA